MGTSFSRRTRRQIPATCTEQTRAATTEAIPTPANGTRTETVVAGTVVVGHARHQIPATEQQSETLVASISETSPTPANVTRTEADAAGTVVVGHARHQIPTPEQQTRVASISETSPTPANVTRTETDAAGTEQRPSHPGDGLTLVKLKMMKKADGKPLKIIQKIAAGDYMTFGMLLLQDDNGEEVTVIKRDHIHDGAESVTQTILIKWLTSGAAPTRTYQHLIECLRQSELGALADNIADTVAGEDDADRLVPYTSYLKGLYMSMSHQQISQHWTHLPWCEFIQLALITDEKVRRSGPTEEFVQLAQVGRIETIMSRSQQVDLVDLFSLPSKSPPNPPPPSPSSLSPTSHQMDQQSILNVLMMLPPLKHRIFLIEGPPGGGKSTLALHICHKWALGASFLARFDLVVLAYLRDRAVQNATTLADILPADITRGAMCTSDIATQIMAFNGLRVLFIFDGWDEFPSHLQNESLVSTIIQKPHKIRVQQSTVIITSRPVASGNLLHIADRRVEILGFTQYQIREYIEKALNGNSTHIQKLVQYLENHPVIQGYCYTSLHTAILVHVFLTMDKVLPTTLHELFCSLVLCCIVRELETHDSKRRLPELSSLNDLPGDLKSQLSHLCVLAYEGVIHDKVVFYQRDLEASQLPANLPSLGILQAVEGLTLYSKSLSYNFLHLSVQELLAAYHISQMDPSKQLEIFQSLLKSPRFQPVLQYYSGFTKLENQGIRGFVSAYTQQQSGFDKLLPFLHCFFEAQQVSLCKLVDHKFRMLDLRKHKSLNPVDYLAVGYFMASLLTVSTSDAPSLVHFETNHISIDGLKLLINELSKYPSGNTVASSGKLAVTFHEQVFGEEEIKLIASHLKQSPAISELMIHCVTIESDEHCLPNLSEALQTSSLTKLQLKRVKLHMQYTEEIGSALSTLLTSKSCSLLHLDLSSNRSFSSPGAFCIFVCLQHNYTVVHLNLSNIAIADSGVLQVSKSLEHNTTLVHLDLCKTGMTEKGVVYIAQLLNSNCSIQTLDISGNHIGEYGFACIAKSLEFNLTIKRLYVTYAGEIDKHVKAVYQARRDKKCDPFKVFNDYSMGAKSSAEGHVRNTDGKYIKPSAVDRKLDPFTKYSKEAETSAVYSTISSFLSYLVLQPRVPGDESNNVEN